MKKLLIIGLFALVACGGDEDEKKEAPKPLEFKLEVDESFLSQDIKHAVDQFFIIAERQSVPLKKENLIVKLGNSGRIEVADNQQRYLFLDERTLEIIKTNDTGGAVTVYVAKQLGLVFKPGNLACVNKWISPPYSGSGLTSQQIGEMQYASNRFDVMIYTIVTGNMSNCPL